MKKEDVRYIIVSLIFLVIWIILVYYFHETIWYTRIMMVAGTIGIGEFLKDLAKLITGKR